MTAELYLRDLIAGRRSPPLLKRALYAASLCYRAAVACRHFAYDKHLFTSASVPIPVISIGNIAAGGTGKTPLVQLLAAELLQVCKIAILSRGYRSKIEKSGESLLISRGVGPLFPPDVCGDEPHWLANSLQGALIFVGRDRSASARKAYQNHAEAVILDDGFQHRRLKRDSEIVVIDAQDPFGKGYFLPRGFLRDAPERLSTANLIVAANCDTQEECERLKKEIAPFSSAPVVGMRLIPKEEEDLREKRVGLFCGIGNPERFLKTVERLGGCLVDTFFMQDHGAYKRESLESFILHCKNKNAEMVVCTEKDWAKLPHHLKPSLPIHPIKMALQIVAGGDHWNNYIETIKRKIYERRV